MNKEKKIVSRALAFVSVFFLVAADLLPLGEVVSRLQKNYDGINSYKAGFSQEVSSTSFGRVISQGKGDVIYQRPGKMYWHYNEPEEHFYITDGKTLWDYTPSEKQVVIMDIGEVLKQNIPRTFLFGMGNLKEQFEISFHSGRITDAAGNYWLDLVPKEETDRQVLGKIQFWVDDKEFFVREVELLDALGNKNHLVFKDIKINEKVDEKIFSFVVPEGVEVVRPRAIEPAPNQ